MKFSIKVRSKFTDSFYEVDKKGLEYDEVGDVMEAIPPPNDEGSNLVLLEITIKREEE